MSIQRQHRIIRDMFKALCKNRLCIQSQLRLLARSAATLSVHPKECLVDELIDIRVDGLNPYQSVTIKLSAEDNNDEFASIAHFKADDQGTVDLTKDESLGGNYTGAMPMGLFCSVIPATGQRRGSRLIKRDVTMPFNMELSVLDGHLPFETVSRVEYSDAGLCGADVKRWYMAKGVTRQEIEVDNGVCGTLFLPSGDGPFPGVIDMFGSVGGIVEFRAALLASKGFASLALPFFNYKGLPKYMTELKLEYFEDASKWFSAHPLTTSDGIGVIGVSKGAEIALLMGVHCPEVKAVISINGPPFYSAVDLQHYDKTIPGYLGDLSKLVYTDNGLIMKHIMSSADNSVLYEDEMRAKVLLLLSMDDHCVDPLVHIKTVEALSPEQRRLFEIVQYSGAGHLLEPPYSPLCTFSYHSSIMQFVVWGGNVKQHAEAQNHSWTRMLSFLTENLMP